MTRVHRVAVISYPLGSDAPGWAPPGWPDPELPWRKRRELIRRGFRWPRRRQFLSSSGAWGLASLLLVYGCEVEVQSSDPVSWTEEPLQFKPADVGIEAS
jgi:hypothetical protein